MDFEDRVVIVTGGGTGIGRAAALQFAKAGAKVLITGRREEPLEETASEHTNIAHFVADVSDPEAVRGMVEDALRRWSRVDVVVNNAAAMAQEPLGEVQAETITLQTLPVPEVGLGQRGSPSSHRYPESKILCKTQR